jgi:hypothetical protein
MANLQSNTGHEDRCVGCLLGTACGDILGAAVEGLPASASKCIVPKSSIACRRSRFLRRQARWSCVGQRRQGDQGGPWARFLRKSPGTLLRQIILGGLLAIPGTRCILVVRFGLLRSSR